MGTRTDSIENGKPSQSTTSLSAEEIHTVLSNSRRREVIKQLQTNGDGMAARELAERIAELESGESPAPRNKRQSAYVALQQTHLPKLDKLGIIEYDSQSKHVRLRDSVAQVTEYMREASPHSASQPDLFLGIGVLGLLLVLGSDIGLPVLGAVPPQYWAYGLLAVVITIAGLQSYQRRSVMGKSEGLR